MKSKVPDLYRTQLKVIGTEIYEALKKDDIDTLKGIQSFASPLWSWTHAGTALICYLVIRMVDNKYISYIIVRQKYAITVATAAPYMPILGTRIKFKRTFPKAWITSTLWENLYRSSA